MRKLAVVVLGNAIVVFVVGAVLAAAPRAAAKGATPYVWQNCTHVHTKYRHGVGKRYSRPDEGDAGDDLLPEYPPLQSRDALQQ